MMQLALSDMWGVVIYENVCFFVMSVFLILSFSVPMGI
jgi:hypothetical protein